MRFQVNSHARTGDATSKGVTMQNELANDPALIRALSKIQLDEKLHAAAIEFLELQDRTI